MARYLLDSNAFLWFKIKPHVLRPQARQEIEDGRNQLFVSLASLWELSNKAAAGRLKEYESLLAGDLKRSLDESNFALLPVEHRHVMATARLPHHHSDPFDRMLIAQAQLDGLTLISSDDVFRRYANLSLVRA
jgi:PIN domain nuclease of toxin-antitoxin system